MSGTLAQHRPRSKPQFIGGQPVYKTPRDGGLDLHAIKRTLKPGGLYKDGRCIEWTCLLELKQRHVLDYTPEHHWPSKHARGRVRPRTNAERQRAQRLQDRFTQLSKSMTVDSNKLGAIYDEI